MHTAESIFHPFSFRNNPSNSYTSEIMITYLFLPLNNQIVIGKVINTIASLNIIVKFDIIFSNFTIVLKRI